METSLSKIEILMLAKKAKNWRVFEDEDGRDRYVGKFEDIIVELSDRRDWLFGLGFQIKILDSEKREIDHLYSEFSTYTIKEEVKNLYYNTKKEYERNMKLEKQREEQERNEIRAQQRIYAKSLLYK